MRMFFAALAAFFAFIAVVKPGSEASPISAMRVLELSKLNAFCLEKHGRLCR